MTEHARAHVLPLAVYLIGTTVAAYADKAYPIVYTAVVIASLITLWTTRKETSSVRPHRRVAAGVVVGLVGIVVWIGLSSLNLEAAVAAYLPSSFRPAERTAFNPFAELSHAGLAWLFTAVRIIGLVIVVPWAEELFWRGFLLRWTIADRWQQVPVGTFSLPSFLIVTALFTLAHPEWFAAAVYCMLLNALVYWKRDIWVCMVAHAVSNLVLAIYVLSTGNWWLW